MPVFIQMIISKLPNISLPNFTLWCIIMSWSVIQKNCCAICKVKVIVRAHVIKIWQFLLYFLNCWSFCYQTLFESTLSYARVSYWNFEPFLCPWPWPQHSCPVFSQEDPAHDDGPSKPSLVARRSAVKMIYWKVIFWFMIFHCDLDLEDSKSVFLEDNLTRDDASLY